MGRAKTLICVLVAKTLGVAALPADAEIWVVATQANNIHCEVGDDLETASLTCNLFRRSGPFAQPKPEDCDASWGHAFFISDRGPVRMLCLQEWQNDWPGNAKFDAGKATRFGGITCKATRRRLKCSNLDGHGFLLSRQSQQVF